MYYDEKLGTVYEPGDVVRLVEEEPKSWGKVGRPPGFLDNLGMPVTIIETRTASYPDRATYRVLEYSGFYENLFFATDVVGFVNEDDEDFEQINMTELITLFKVS